MRRSILGLFLALPLLSCDHGGTESPPPEPQADFPSATILNARLGQGVNLGNALDAPKEGDWGVTLKADYFRWIADSGFKTVRIPVCWSAHAGTESPYAIDSAFLERVAWAVDQALAAKLNAVVDMHHYHEIMADPAGERSRFLSMWKQIAKRFAGYPPELLFEILNEPREKLDAPTWNEYLGQAIDTIRVLNPRRTLVVGTSPWGGLQGLSQLKLPDDSNLIVTVHYYDPHAFTHQGAAFEPGADAFLGTPWTATPAERAVVDQDIGEIKAWAAENDRPVFLGEFGTYYRADPVYRAMYTEYLTRAFESAGFSWALWNFSSDFGIMNDTTEVWRGYLMDALLHHGRNTALDSILKSATPIDLSTYVVMEDFDDDRPELPLSARRWQEKKGRPLDASAASWFSYYSDSSQVRAADGTRIRQYFEKDTVKDAYGFASLIGDWGDRGKGLHAKIRLQGGNYPYGGFGAGILGGWDSTFVDLTKLTAIQFRAKGRGQWFMQLVSDSINSDTVENWGHMSYQLRLKKDWETWLIPAETLAPKPDSKQAAQKLTWADVRNKIISIEFLSGRYGEHPNDSLEIWLDDIRLIGVDDGDLGLK